MRSLVVVLPLRLGFARQVMRGISAWVRASPDWAILPCDHGAMRYFAERGIRHAGCIGFLGSGDLQELAHRVAPAVVNVSAYVPPSPSCAHVLGDDTAVGSLAVAYFARRGYLRLGYAATGTSYWSTTRWQALAVAARAAGMKPSSLTWQDRDSLVATLKGLEQPMAVLAENDDTGLTLLREARLAGIPVPSGLAVLGVDDDDLLVESEVAPLGSVRPAGQRIGWLSAELIATGKAKQGTVIRVPPEGITERRSCQGLAVDDARLARVLRAMEEGFREEFDFGAVAARSGLGRRNAFLLFRKLLGTTPAEHLGRLRLAEAERLLARTDLPVETVAERSGLENAVTLWRVFKRSHGCSPGAWRKRWL